jgi:DNA-directed RNA polymerase subunit L
MSEILKIPMRQKFVCTENVTIRVSAQLRNRIMRMKDEKGVDMPEVLRTAIESAVSKVERAITEAETMAERSA